jgi:TolB-like protein
MTDICRVARGPVTAVLPLLMVVGCSITTMYGRAPRVSPLSPDTYDFTVYFNAFSSQEAIDRRATVQIQALMTSNGYRSYRLLERKCQSLVTRQCDYQVVFSRDELGQSGTARDSATTPSRPAATDVTGQLVSMDQAIEQVGADLANTLRGERRLRLAVSDLLDLRGVTTVLGRYVAERLTTRLSTQATWFSVMERRRVGQVLNELDFGAYDLIQPANARRFGRMIGVDALMVGTLSVFPERVDIDVRVVDIESSQILGAAQATMRRTSGMSSMLEEVRTDTAQVRRGLPPPSQH